MRMGFHARLLAALVLTLAAVGAVQYAVLAHAQRRQLVHDEQLRQSADAAAVERAYSITVPGEVPLNSVNRYLRAVAARSGNQRATLVNPKGQIVAGATLIGLGARETNPQVMRTLRRGTRYAGRDRDFDRSGGHMLYVSPVALPKGRYAIVVRQRRSVIDGRLSSLRRTLILLLLGGGLLAVPAFYVLGGRSLGRLHRTAVERATHDGLTDLGNQRAFHDELVRAVSLAQRHVEPLAVGLIDIDDFRFENDRLGHGHGDRLLCEVAAQLRVIRTEDIAFRVGGDEFAVLLPRTGEHDARVALERMTAELRSCCGVEVSIGLAVLGPQTEDDESLREQADAAVFEAKRRGGARIVSFREIEGESNVVTVAKVRAVRRLLAEGNVAAAYQPIWDVGADEIIGYEGLARPSEEYGLNGPAEAFDVAAAIGRSPELDDLCRRVILAGASRLPEGALLFLNVAPQGLDHERLAGDSLARVVRDAGLEPERVVLEVTERFTGPIDRVVREARRLAGYGFKLALDDVGAGNSGLEMLRDLEVDYVKVDREVVVRGVDDLSARAVLVSIMAFARQTGAFVIAEGIENQAMLDLVRDPTVMGDLKPTAQGVQGYMFGRPGALPEPPVAVTVNP